MKTIKNSPRARNTYATYLNEIKYVDNTSHVTTADYQYQDILSLKNYQKAHAEITSWDSYQPTPLVQLTDLATETGVEKIYYKDENFRFSLKSFKALGGAYAVANVLIAELKKLDPHGNSHVNSRDLSSGKYAEFTKKITVACATDGNHGKSVAWGAAQFSCQCAIFIHQNVSETRSEEIAKYGATVHRVKGNYDDSVDHAAKIAREQNYHTVADTAYEGYTEIPKDVMQGYTIMVAEAVQQMAEKPSHVFIQGGVGGLAAAVIAWFVETDGRAAPKFILIEPNNAACLLQSAKHGRPTEVHGDLATVMAGLACGVVSSLAWPILADRVHGFCAIPDAPIATVMQYLAACQAPIIAGESAVAGLAGYLILQNDAAYRTALNINAKSKILCFGTEGDTDAVIYQQLVGKTAEELLKNY